MVPELRASGSGHRLGPASWLSIAQIIVVASAALRAVAGARLVTPSEFGVYAVAIAAYGVLDAMTQPGISDAIVAAPEKPRATVLRTLWSILFVRGVILSGSLFVAAPVVARLLGIQEAGPVLRLIAIAPLLRSLTSLWPAVAQRSLRLGPLAAMNLTGALAGLLGTVVGAFVWRSAQGLAVGVVAEAAARTLVSYWGDRAPRLRLQLREVTSYLRFASWRFGSSLLAYAAMNLDDLIVGALGGARAAGGYRIGYRLASAPISEPFAVLGQLAVPGIAAMERAGTGQTRLAYLSYVRLCAATTGAVAAVTIPLAPGLVSGILGEQWSFIVAPFRIFAIGAVGRAIMATGGHLFIGIGRPAAVAVNQAVRLAVLIIGLLVAVPIYGVLGAAWASTGSVAFGMATWAYQLRWSSVGVVETLKAVSRGFPPALAVAAATAVGARLVDGSFVATLLVAAIAAAVGGMAVWWDAVLRRDLRTIRGVIRRPLPA